MFSPSQGEMVDLKKIKFLHTGEQLLVKSPCSITGKHVRKLIHFYTLQINTNA